MHIFYEIFKCTLKHFVWDFTRLPVGANWNFAGSKVTSDSPHFGNKSAAGALTSPSGTVGQTKQCEKRFANITNFNSDFKSMVSQDNLKVLLLFILF